MVPLPPYARRIEYLESTGTQYIDTLYNVNTDTDEIHVSFRLMADTAYKWCFGEYDSGKQFAIGRTSSTNAYLAYVGVTTIQASLISDSRCEFVADSTGVKINGENRAAFSSFSSTSNIILFSLRRTGYSDTNYSSVTRIYSYKHWRQGVLIRDFVPCCIGSTGYLFDRVSGQLFGNQGTGNFVLGPYADSVPLPSYAKRVEYLESTGTQWIDTGVYGGSGIVTKARVYWPYQNQIQGIVFGSLYIDANSLSYRYMLQRHENRASFYTDKNTTPAKVMVSSGWYDTELNAPGKFVSVNGQKVSKTVSTYSLVRPTIGLFARRYVRDNVSPTTYGVDNISVAGVRMASCEIFSGTVPVRSFVPCRILDVGYLWDEVEGKFYGNSGTGDFVLGPDVQEGVVPTPLSPFGIGRRQEEIRRIEYLESTGTQWIDTGVVPNPQTEIRLQATVTQTAGRGLVYTYPQNENSELRLFFNLSGATFYYDRGPARLQYGTTVRNLDLVATNYALYLSGAQVASGTTQQWTGTTALRVFGNIANAGKYDLMQLRALQILEGSVLLRDFVPVAIGSTGYLLDRVSGRLFGNQGTGDFVLGPDIAPVEYVESGGEAVREH